MTTSTLWRALGRRMTFRRKQLPELAGYLMVFTSDHWLGKSWLSRGSTSGSSRRRKRDRLIASPSAAEAEQLAFMDHRTAQVTGCISPLANSNVVEHTSLNVKVGCETMKLMRFAGVQSRSQSRSACNGPDRQINGLRIAVRDGARIRYIRPCSMEVDTAICTFGNEL